MWGRCVEKCGPPYPVVSPDATPLHGLPLQVLIIKRGKEPDKGKWSFPGGTLELGELKGVVEAIVTPGSNPCGHEAL